MRCSLLGDDTVFESLISFIAQADSHSITSTALMRESTRKQLKDMRGVVVYNHWEDLLQDGEMDLLIVAGGNGDVMEGAKKFATTGIPILFFPHPQQDGAAIYELNLIQDEQETILIPAFLDRFDQEVEQIRNIVSVSKTKQLEDVQFDRLVDLETESRVSREDFDRFLLNDADLVRFLFGEYNEVTCLETSPDASSLSKAIVTLGGGRVTTVTWTIKPAQKEAAGFKIAIRNEDGRHEYYANHRNRHSLFLKLFTEVNHAIEQGDDHNAWNSFIKASEIVQGAHRSVRRRRTIDLHFETTSERSQFKTQMTAIGCSLLSLTLFALIGSLMIGYLNVPRWVMKVLQIGIFMPLVFFLLLQLFLFISKPASHRDEIDESQIPS